MYKTPVSGRLHIGIFGKRNSGKSSLINALTGQPLAIVSDVAGTTADPVFKTMEILPIGPCVIIDTAGIDDEGALGKLRIKKTLGVVEKTDIAVIVVEAGQEAGKYEDELVDLFKKGGIPFFFAVNKSDLGDSESTEASLSMKKYKSVPISCTLKKGIENFKRALINEAPRDWAPVPLIGDVLKEKQTAVLVCPVDSAMPQGRLILPEVQVLRDVLDSNAAGFVTKDTELRMVLNSLRGAPDLVVTDSQVFETVKDIIPEDVPLTSFSIVYARHKGDLNEFIKGAKAISGLKDHDRVLISESCTHHPQPEDIGRVKLPNWIKSYTGKELRFDTVPGGHFPEDISQYSLVVQCGGCMVNRRLIISRISSCREAGVPITNYGVIIAYMNGISGEGGCSLQRRFR
ncbi:MAG: [FeFe] hydrogenase H-cluster maturation GTPase HydF [Fibrobacterota bacterium]